MKVIILCGGVGTRLKEETEFKPKPMVYVGDKPIIWHIMKTYARYGYNEFILALGYKSDYIKNFFLNQKAITSDFTLETIGHKAKYHLSHRKEIDDFVITFVDTGVETLIGERILRCQDYIPKNDKYFMVTYGDGVADIDISKLVAFHKQRKTIGTITAVHPRSKYGLVKSDGKGYITGFEEKPQLSDWVNGGFMVFKRDYLSYLRPGEMDFEALRRIAAEKELSMYKHDGFWYAVDTYKELEDLNAIYKKGNAPWVVWK
jgi:glucose-1-phosphate cytidylyltransferase